MKHELFNKAISAVVASSIVLTSGVAAFATSTPKENTEFSLFSEEPNSEGAVAVDISANYFTQEDGTYNVVFSSLDALESLKNFFFTVTLTDATLTSPDFGPSLKTGSYIIESVGSNSVNFKSGSADTLLSGKLVLASITTNVLPTAETLSFSNFTAVKSDGTAVTFAPTLTIEEGPVVPELSEKEQAVYDSIIALPAESALSFYDEDSNLISVSELKEKVTAAVNTYNKLSAKEKSHVEEVLVYNMKSLDILTTLPPIVDAMNNVYDVLDLAAKLNDVEDDDIANHKFIIDLYESIKSKFSTDGLPNPSALYTEYTNAVTLLTSSGDKITTQLEAMDYSKKIDNVAKQTELAKPNTADKYYKEYLSCILTYANSLYEDMEENCTDRYKDYMLQELSEKISAVKALQNNLTSLPSFTVGNVTRARNYTITIERKSTAKTEATVNIYVYAESNLNKTIDSKEITFKASSKEAKTTLTALKNVYPAANKNIVIKITYTLDGVTYDLGSKTVVCHKEQVNPGIVSSPATTSPSKKDDTTESVKPSGTVFPDAKDDDKDDNKKPEPETKPELFGDISSYSWATEAIEGLYYAGIINGMEEGVFNPSGNVTREQFCKMVVQLFNVLDYEAVSTFVDVDPNAWYAPYINSAIKAGYVQGQSSEYFGIGENIMRQDMATILYRGLGSQGKSTVLSFTDNDKIAEYAKEAIAEFVGLGILTGYEDGSFNPRGTATRAEAAKLIWGVYQIINNK